MMAQATAAKPAIISGVPAFASGAAATFTFTARDADGAADIARLYWLIADAPIIAANGCHGFYDRATNALHLYDDSLNSALGPLGLGVSGSVKNSQCGAAGEGATVTASGNDLALTVSLSVTPGYGAAGKVVYLWAKDKGGRETGWIKTGTWAVPPAPPPQPDPAAHMEVHRFEVTVALDSEYTLPKTPAPGSKILLLFSSLGVLRVVDVFSPMPPGSGPTGEPVGPRTVRINVGSPGVLVALYWTAE